MNTFYTLEFWCLFSFCEGHLLYSYFFNQQRGVTSRRRRAAPHFAEYLIKIAHVDSCRSYDFLRLSVALHEKSIIESCSFGHLFEALRLRERLVSSVTIPG